jgi:hypothetical protein
MEILYDEVTRFSDLEVSSLLHLLTLVNGIVLISLSLKVAFAAPSGPSSYALHIHPKISLSELLTIFIILLRNLQKIDERSDPRFSKFVQSEL